MNKLSKKALHDLRSYNAEHEKRDSEGRFTTEHERHYQHHHNYTERCRDEEGRFAPNEECENLHDERSRNAEREKRDSHGCFEK